MKKTNSNTDKHSDDIVQWDTVIVTGENAFDCGPREDLSEEAAFELR